MRVPPAIVRVSQGNRLWVGGAVEAPGYSIIGTHTVCITGLPGIYVHDTGGLLGGELVHKLEGRELFEPPRVSGQWAPHQPSLSLRVQPTASHRVHLSVDGVDAMTVERSLATAMPASRRRGVFSGFARFSTELHFRRPRPSIESAIRSTLASAGIDDAQYQTIGLGLRANPAYPPSLDVVDTLGRLCGIAPDAGLLLEALHYGKVALHVLIADGRLLLHDGAPMRPVVDLPAGSLRLERLGARHVRISMPQVIAGEPVDGLTIYFPHESYTDDFCGWGPGGAAAGSPGDDSRLVTSARLIGELPSLPERSSRVDLVIRPDTIELLHPLTSRRLHSFSLANAGVSGTGTRFLLGDEQVAALLIEHESVTVAETMLQVEGIREAAARTARLGPHLVVDGNGEPARARIVDGCLRLDGSREPPMPLATLESREVQVADGAATLHLVAGPRRLDLSGSFETLEAIAVAITKVVLARSGDRIDELARALVKVETDAWVYSLLGPFGEAHLNVVGASAEAGAPELAGAGVRASLAPTERSAQDQLAFLAMLGAAAPLLRRHLDACLLRLPALVLERDARLLQEAVGQIPGTLYELEPVWHASAAALMSTARSIDVIDREVQRVESVRKLIAQSRPTSAGLYLSLAASAINPVFLIGAAQQLVARDAAGARQRDQEASTTAEACAAVAGEWTYLVAELIPAIRERIVRLVAPARERVALSLAGAHARAGTDAARRQILEALVRRYAQLDTWLAFPGDTERGRPRAAIVRLFADAAAGSPSASFAPF